MPERLLQRRSAESVEPRRGNAIGRETIEQAKLIVEDVARRGVSAIREYALRFGEIKRANEPLVLDRAALRGAASRVPAEDLDLLERTADRIRRFATAQRGALRDVEVTIPGGAVAHRVMPVERAGCYAPGGRFPLPSSVLMTAVTARAADVDQVIVASPNPSVVTLAAAFVAGADRVFSFGGAHAIAAMAFGSIDELACDAVVGPGNKWVTAAKYVVSDRVRIDMLAGPSELLILADNTADPETIAADLLAQAEHDVDAVPMLIVDDDALADAVDQALHRQLSDLPTGDIAQQALRNGFVVVASSTEETIALANRIAPEHLELCLQDASSIVQHLRHYGAVFVGSSAAEVLGDYGAGPNHTLPTGGTASHASGLSVLDFLRVQTSLCITDRAQARLLCDDATRLARLEGLEGHARSAERRRGASRTSSES